MNKTQLEQYLAHENVKLIDAMNKIDKNTNGVLFVLNNKDELCGAVSDGDIRRWILANGAIDTEIYKIMNVTPKYLHEHERHRARKYMEEYEVRAIPIVNDAMHVIDVEVSKKMRQKPTASIDTAVIIMAGGKGTRLYPYTKVLPKPLIPIGDIPIMERIINLFCSYGIVDYYVTVNYKKNMIKSYFRDIGVDYHMTYVEEEQPLGTAGGIRLIKQKFDTPVFVTNCDVIIKADYAELYEYHKRSENAITIVTSLRDITVPYGVIHAKEDGEVINMEEKPSMSYFINTGMYIINPEVIDIIPKDKFFHMTDLTDQVLKMGWKVGMYPVSEEAFLDMGEFAEMKRMEEKLDI